MDVRDKRLLQKKRSYLKDHIILTTSFKDGLTEIFPREVVDDIFLQQKDDERLTMMIDLLCKRDEYAMRNFLHLLRETGHEFIADHLTEHRDIDLVATEASGEIPIDMKNFLELSLSRSSTSLSSFSALLSRLSAARTTGTPHSTARIARDRASTRPSTRGTQNTALSAREPTDFITLAEREQDMIDVNERFNQMNKRIDNSVEKIRSLEEELLLKEERLRENELKSQRLDEEIEQMKKENTHLLHERGEADAQCLLTNKILRELQQKDLHLKKRSEDLEDEVRVLRKKIAAVMNDELSASKQSISRENEVLKIKTSLQRVKQQNDRLKRRNDKLEMMNSSRDE